TVLSVDTAAVPQRPLSRLRGRAREGLGRGQAERFACIRPLPNPPPQAGEGAERCAWRPVRHCTRPAASRRSTRPGRAPVWVAFSTTIAPLTITVVRAPLGYW